MASPMTLGPRKEWIIPPRPKPGRKPATDTPPTKRKAQNRAAQRAFRERRAARVGELEEQLKETEEERLKREALMKAELDEARAHITKIEADLRRAADDSQQYQSRALRAEDMLDSLGKEAEALKVEIAYLRNGARSTGTDAVALPPRRRRNPPRMTQQSRPLASRTNSSEVKPHPLDCGTCSSTGRCACIEQITTITTTSCSRCSLDITRCQCLDETLNTLTTSLNNTILPEMDMKRAFASSSPIMHSKRPRLSIEEQQPQEIDFTAMFSSKPSIGLYQPQKDRMMDYASEISISRPPPGETCGFCDGGGFCACAEAAATQARDQAMEMENRLPPLLSEVTPPPSDTDIAYAESYKLPSLHPDHFLHQTNTNPTQSQSMLSMSRPQSSAGQQQTAAQSSGNSCANGPGTCKQCQDDPKSGLFCRSLAAIRASNPSFSGCCGNGGPGGCCKDEKKAAPPPIQRTLSQPVLSHSHSRNSEAGASKQSELALSCAETYKTLASHKNFDIASGEIREWLPKLETVAPGKYPGRGAMDIDAASVMSVIKYFDVRFGRE